MTLPLSSDMPNSGGYRCDCKNLITVAALCEDKPIIIAPDLALLKESAQRQDACPFCFLCWAALEQVVPKQGLDVWSTNFNRRVRVQVTGDFKFLTDVRMADGRLLEGLVKRRYPEGPVPRKVLPDSLGSEIEI